MAPRWFEYVPVDRRIFRSPPGVPDYPTETGRMNAGLVVTRGAREYVRLERTLIKLSGVQLNSLRTG